MKHINNYPVIYKRAAVTYYHKTDNKISEILNIYNISNGSLYNWINADKNNKLSEKKKYTKGSKYTPEIKCYIRGYVLRKNVFDMNKLLMELKKKYNIIAHKSSVYKIIKSLNLIINFSLKSNSNS